MQEAGTLAFDRGPFCSNSVHLRFPFLIFVGADQKAVKPHFVLGWRNLADLRVLQEGVVDHLRLLGFPVGIQLSFGRLGLQQGEICEEALLLLHRLGLLVSSFSFQRKKNGKAFSLEFLGVLSHGRLFGLILARRRSEDFDLFLLGESFLGLLVFIERLGILSDFDLLSRLALLLGAHFVLLHHGLHFGGLGKRTFLRRKGNGDWGEFGENFELIQRLLLLYLRKIEMRNLQLDEILRSLTRVLSADISQGRLLQVAFLFLDVREVLPLAEGVEEFVVVLLQEVEFGIRFEKLVLVGDVFHFVFKALRDVAQVQLALLRLWLEDINFHYIIFSL